ncbi:MAG: hypothetical protein U5O39_08460 [Gammaproteobacteria bacterium]|nr:hypothetical protein [Gammaproteobacteria bacterium]
MPDTASLTATITTTNGGNIEGTQAFTTVENLTGGTNDDTFSFTGTGTLSGQIDGATGSDTVTYASLIGPVTITLGTDVTGVENLTGSGNAEGCPCRRLQFDRQWR